MSAYYQHIKARWADLAQTARGIIPAELPTEPLPSEVEKVADDLILLAEKVDALIEAYGEYLAFHSRSCESRCYQSVLLNAMAGEALYDIERIASDICDERSESSYYAKHNAGAVE